MQGAVGSRSCSSSQKYHRLQIPTNPQTNKAKPGNQRHGCNCTTTSVSSTAAVAASWVLHFRASPPHHPQLLIIALSGPAAHESHAPLTTAPRRSDSSVPLPHSFSGRFWSLRCCWCCCCCCVRDAGELMCGSERRWSGGGGWNTVVVVAWNIMQHVLPCSIEKWYLSFGRTTFSNSSFSSSFCCCCCVQRETSDCRMQACSHGCTAFYTITSILYRQGMLCGVTSERRRPWNHATPVLQIKKKAQLS